MRPPRIALLVLFFAASLFLVCRSIGSVRRPGPGASSPSASASSSSQKSSFRTLFSFTSPFSLFPPSAAISLTDDNSTFFPARPAAFGPPLPAKGLSGELWIGSGFSDETLQEGEGEGELGCSDIPGWEDGRLQSTIKAAVQGSAGSNVNPLVEAAKTSGMSDLGDSMLVGWDAASRKRSRAQPSRPDDGTDDYLHQALQQARNPYSDEPTGPGTDHADIQSMQESAEITGKIALLSRGGCGFLEKVKWAQRRGAIALIVGDNQRGGPLIQMFARGNVDNVTIPSVFTSWTTAHLLSSLMQPVDARDDKNNKLFKSSVDKAAKDSTKGPRGSPEDSFQLGGQEWRGPKRAGDAESSPGDARANEITEHTSGRTGGDSATTPASAPTAPAGDDPHEGLWVTITPTGSASPFFDTLLVLVISPLITLTVVYALLILRVKIRMRRWRAPKSVVDRLPVRTYHTIAPSPAPSPRTRSPQAASPRSPSPTTPLLQSSSETQPQSQAVPSTSDSGELGGANSSSQAKRTPSRGKNSRGLSSEWRKYMGRQVECVVCLEEYVDGVSRVMSLPCGHEFHAECITPWLTTRRRTCPICKNDVVRSLARGTSSGPQYEPFREDDYESSGESSDSYQERIPSPDGLEDLERGPSWNQSPRQGWHANRNDVWFSALASRFGESSTFSTRGDDSGADRGR
ncbi:hypothetical protein VTH06DRAFT_8390 [Thermothelomyces fergusii]